MSTIIVRGETLISRPIGDVQSQFADVERHVPGHRFADLEISNVRAQEGGCRFTGRRNVFGMLQEDEIESMRDADGNSTLRSLFGSTPGFLMKQRFASEGKGFTRVHATVEYPVRGMLRLLSPFFRMGLQRNLSASLEQDRTAMERRSKSRN
jgi:hypothetical protein